MAISANDISMRTINSIINPSNQSAQVDMNNTLVRQLLGQTTVASQISLLNASGKPASGSVNYNIPGSYSWLVPIYQTLSVSVSGAGGGGGGGSTFFVYWYPGYAGGNGANSYFYSTTTLAGNRGLGGGSQPGYGGAASQAQMGTASGGDTNTIGGGATGGTGGGGNGAGASQNGGNGGLAEKTWTFVTTNGYPTWGGSINLTVGAGGTGGNPAPQGGLKGGNGSNGYINIVWS